MNRTKPELEQATERLRGIGRRSAAERERVLNERTEQRRRVWQQLPPDMRRDLEALSEAFGKPAASLITQDGQVLNSTIPAEPMAIAILPHVPDKPTPWSPGQPEVDR